MVASESGTLWGTMMDVPLSVTAIAERAGLMFSNRPIVYRDQNGSIGSVTYGDFLRDVRRLAGALVSLGVRPGDRVASFAWNTVEHLALYFAVPAVGAVLHTVNIRLSIDDVRYLVEDAEDTVLFYDRSLYGALPSDLPHEIQLVEIGAHGEPLGRAVDYDSLVAAGSPDFEFVPVADDRSAAILCYTSGTTGRPKGVAYSHKSLCLYVLMANQPDAFGIAETDTVLPIVPMFHANAWGFPFIAAMSGARLVLPGESPGPESIVELIRTCGVTVAAAVPTVWQGVLSEASRDDLCTLREIVAGGSAVPEALIRAYDSEFGVPMVQGWGMTETSPLAALSRVTDRRGESDDAYAMRSRQGRPLPFVATRLDNSSGGELQLRGPSVTGSYLRGSGADSFTPDGWLRTGDIAEIDETYSIRLIDRTKDLVKSGGEWISSVELENAALYHDAILEAAVIGLPDSKWGERPHLFAVVDDAAQVTEDEIREFLGSRFPRWWIPDSVAFVTSIPKTSVGKIDKKRLRSTGLSNPIT